MENIFEGFGQSAVGVVILIAAVGGYVIGLVAAYKSWKKYRFSSLLFVPMALLLFVAGFIFPIFAQAEYNMKKRIGGYDLSVSKTKVTMAWFVVLAAWLPSWLFNLATYMELGESFFTTKWSPTSVSFYPHIIFFLFTFVFLWFSRKIEKWEKPGNNVT